MTFASKVRCLVIVFCCAMLAGGIARAADVTPVTETAQQKVLAIGLGHTVKLKRGDGSKTKGVITAIGADFFDVKAKGLQTPVSIQYASVASVRQSIGDRIGATVGPCSGIEALPITVPVILVKAMFGH